MTFPHRTRFYETWAPFVARLLFGFQFIFAAYGKIPGTPPFQYNVQAAAAHGVPLASAAVLLAFILELVAGVMLIMGWHARAAAAVLAAYVLLLGLIFYHSWGGAQGSVELGMFITHLSMVAGLLYVSVYGAKSTAILKD